MDWTSSVEKVITSAGRGGRERKREREKEKERESERERERESKYIDNDLSWLGVVQ